MPKISQPPTVATLIDRTTRSLNALRVKLLVEHDTAKLVDLHGDIAVKSAKLDHLKAEQANG